MSGGMLLFPIGKGLQLVFADENDRYFTDSLLRLTLHQYLWFHLRGQFEAVCFLNASDDGKGFFIHTFGDSDKMLPNDWLHGIQQTLSTPGKAQKLFQKWLKGKTAIVCPARDFCKVMSQSGWKDCFERIAKLVNLPSSSGILLLTASCYAEENNEWMCEDSLLAREDFCLALHKTISKHETYEYLQQTMGDSCFFLSAYTPEAVYPIVLRAAMANPKRLEQVNILDRIADYLVFACTNIGSRETLGKGGKRISFEELYRYLSLDDRWDKLLSDSENSTAVPINRTSVFHVGHSYAAKCLSLPTTAEVEEDRDARRALRFIYSALSEPHCCAENPDVVQKLEFFLDRALQRFKVKDWDTYKICIQAIDFAIRHIYDRPGTMDKTVIEILKSYKTYIELSMGCEDSKRLSKRSFANTKLGQKAHETLTEQIELTEKQMKHCRDAILAMTVSLSTSKIPDIPEAFPEKYSSSEGQMTKPVDYPSESEDIYLIRETDFDF